MDILMASLRILHIVAGVFWAGSVFFLVLILEPQLRKLGPMHMKPVMGPSRPSWGQPSEALAWSPLSWASS